jgi:hypothetical protein
MNEGDNSPPRTIIVTRIGIFPFFNTSKASTGEIERSAKEVKRLGLRSDVISEAEMRKVLAACPGRLWQSSAKAREEL